MANISNSAQTKPSENARLQGPELHERAKRVPEWRIEKDAELAREFRFPDFASALAFVNRIGAIAERANHHPDLTLSWGKVGIRLSTHSAGGLTHKDFELATTISALPL